MDSKSANLEQIYSEICDGFSENGLYKINHLSFVAESKLKKFYTEALARYLALGAKSEKQIVAESVASGMY